MAPGGGGAAWGRQRGEHRATGALSPHDGARERLATDGGARGDGGCNAALVRASSARRACQRSNPGAGCGPGGCILSPGLARRPGRAQRGAGAGGSGHRASPVRASQPLPAIAPDADPNSFALRSAGSYPLYREAPSELPADTTLSAVVDEAEVAALPSSAQVLGPLHPLVARVRPMWHARLS